MTQEIRGEDLSFGMDRSDYVLPPFARILWASLAAKEKWMPRVRRIAMAWISIERRAVLEKAKSCCIQTAEPGEFVDIANELADTGLLAIPLSVKGGAESADPSGSVAYSGASESPFHFVVGKPSNLFKFKEVWDKCDNLKIAKLLGYPDCCSIFFQQVSVRSRIEEVTWPMAWSSAPTKDGEKTIKLSDFPVVNNILWGWAGIRAVSHSPCSFQCKQSEEIGYALMEIGRDVGFSDEVDWLLEILSWPVEWSALHGINEIKTPILKVSRQTDSTAEKYVVQLKSTHYPNEGMYGNGYPYVLGNKESKKESG